MKTLRTSHLALLAVLAVSPMAFAQQRAPAPGAKPQAAPSASAPAAAPSASAPAAPASASAPASPPATPSLADSLTGQAKTDYESARMLLGVNDFAGALLKFKSAYDTSKDPRLLYDMAASESKLHHYARALGYMQRYLKEAASVITPQEQAEAAQAIAAMQPLTSSVTVNVTEPGADVTIDDELLGQSPLTAPVTVDMGSHKVRVHKDGFQDFTADLQLNGGSQTTVDARLAQVVHEGRLSVRAGGQDQIALDGAPVGTGTWTGVLHSGGHTLRVTAPGMQAYQTEVLIQDGQTRDIGVTLNPEPHGGLPAWAWIAGGVVVAGGLGVGGYFLFKPTTQYTGPQGNLGPGIVQANAPVHF